MFSRCDARDRARLQRLFPGGDDLPTGIDDLDSVDEDDDDDSLASNPRPMPAVSRVVHLAARSGVAGANADPEGATDANVASTAVLLDLASAHKCVSFTLASSGSVYGECAVDVASGEPVASREDDPTDQPTSPTAASKRAAELMARAYASLASAPSAPSASSMRVTVARIFTVYGPRGRPDMAVYRLTIDHIDRAGSVADDGKRSKKAGGSTGGIRRGGRSTWHVLPAPATLAISGADPTRGRTSLTRAWRRRRRRRVGVARGGEEGRGCRGWCRGWCRRVRDREPGESNGVPLRRHGIGELHRRRGARVARLVKRTDGADEWSDVTEARGRPGDVGGTFADVSAAKSLIGWEPTIGLRDGVASTAGWYASEVEARAQRAWRDAGAEAPGRIWPRSVPWSSANRRSTSDGYLDANSTDGKLDGASHSTPRISLAVSLGEIGRPASAALLKAVMVNALAIRRPRFEAARRFVHGHRAAATPSLAGGSSWTRRSRAGIALDDGGRRHRRMTAIERQGCLIRAATRPRQRVTSSERSRTKSSTRAVERRALVACERSSRRRRRPLTSRPRKPSSPS